MTKKNESEFGKGVTYNLGLFLAHAERDNHMKDNDENRMRSDWWFNASSDHLYEMQIPGDFPISLQRRLRKFRSEMLDKGHGDGLCTKHSEEEIAEAVFEAQSLLLAIDKLILKVPTCEASWK